MSETSADQRSSAKRGSLATRAIHGDGKFLYDGSGHQVATGLSPNLSFSSTFQVQPGSFETQHIYGRVTAPTRDRVELLLGQLEDPGGYAVTYASGLSAAFAAISHFRPRRIAIDKGYHGTHDVIQLVKSMDKELQVVDLNTSHEYCKGDLLWVETPRNPDGDVKNIQELVRASKKTGAVVVVDATFAPPPLQYCLRLGVDMVMHSATKYLGGHSDMLLGVLMVSQPETRRELIMKRIRFGAVPGNMECWLLLRSLRTLTLRVERQTKTATYLTNALFTAVQNQAHSSLSARESQTIRLVVEEVFYPGLRSSKEELAWLTKQMPGGFGGTFALQLKTKDAAEALVKSCKYWKNATSLGGVESLIDHRLRWDPSVHPGLLRLSCGLEDPGDLLRDLLQGIQAYAETK